MTDSETDQKILARLNDLMSAMQKQGQKIENLTARVEKIENARRPGSRGSGQCDGDCFSISDECLEALNNPDKYKPQPGEKYQKQSKTQAEYKNTFWEKVP